MIDYDNGEEPPKRTCPLGGYVQVLSGNTTSFRVPLELGLRKKAVQSANHHAKASANEFGKTLTAEAISKKIG